MLMSKAYRMSTESLATVVPSLYMQMYSLNLSKLHDVLLLALIVKEKVYDVLALDILSL